MLSQNSSKTNLHPNMINNTAGTTSQGQLLEKPQQKPSKTKKSATTRAGGKSGSAQFQPLNQIPKPQKPLGSQLNKSVLMTQSQAQQIQA